MAPQKSDLFEHRSIWTPAILGLSRSCAILCIWACIYRTLGMHILRVSPVNSSVTHEFQICYILILLILPHPQEIYFNCCLIIGLVFCSLKYINVAMVTVLKNVTNVITALGEMYLFKKHHDSKVWAALFLMVKYQELLAAWLKLSACFEMNFHLKM